jgi:FkbM family methyltransferase
MSAFFRALSDYVARYQVGVLDGVLLGAHYPLFKLAWLARYGDARVRPVADAALRPLGKYEIVHRIKSTYGPLPVRIRFRPADVDSFQEIFWGNEYAMAADISVRTYVDAGANTGMAALYFLTKYPIERAILVEANPRLVPILQAVARDVGAISDVEVQLEHAIVSGAATGVGEFEISDNHRMSHVRQGDEVLQAGKSLSVRRMPLRQLLEKHGLAEVDLLKMDIEGGEYAIMKEDPTVFRAFKAIAIEVHGPPKKRSEFLVDFERLGFHFLRRESGGMEPWESVVAVREKPASGLER